MFYAYILESIKSKKYYIGYTNDLNKRLKLHNQGNVRSTKKDRPWRIFHSGKFIKIADAIKHERQWKSWKSRNALERLKFLQNRGSSISI